jgi:hypothetical protein
VSDDIVARDVIIRQGGARSITADSIVIRQGGAAHAQAGQLAITQGGVGLVMLVGRAIFRRR